MKGMDRFHPNGKESAKMRQILNSTATGTPTIILQLFALKIKLPFVILQQWESNFNWVVNC